MAGNIRIINLRNPSLNDGEVLVRCDRTSVLGSPFYMQGKQPDERMRVCNNYQNYFDTVIGKKSIQEGLNTEYLAAYLAKATRDQTFTARFIAELDRIKSTLKNNDVALGCWCFPLKCHAETIRNYIQEQISHTS